MLVFIILGIIIIGGIVLRIITENELWSIAWLLGGLILIALLISVPWKRSVDLTKAEYEELKKELVQTSEKPESQAVLIGKVCEMNNKIDEHRIYKDSRWVGRLFSEDIANLDKIELK